VFPLPLDIAGPLLQAGNRKLGAHDESVLVVAGRR
jgi:hypothetical protein